MSRYPLKEPLHLLLVPSTPINLVWLQHRPLVRRDPIQKKILPVKAPLPKSLLGTYCQLMAELRLASRRELAQDNRGRNRRGPRLPTMRERGSAEKLSNFTNHPLGVSRIRHLNRVGSSQRKLLGPL
jgi:hypothetical protein